jgi:acetyltransferase-like isoleucine patch superfamily enzyme
MDQADYISVRAVTYSHTTVNRVVTEGVTPTLRAPTFIGDFVHIGAGAIILMGVTIGSHSYVGAGAVVTQFSEFAERSAIIGNPAKRRDDVPR